MRSIPTMIASREGLRVAPLGGVRRSILLAGCTYYARVGAPKRRQRAQRPRLQHTMSGPSAENSYACGREAVEDLSRRSLSRCADVLRNRGETRRTEDSGPENPWRVRSALSTHDRSAGSCVSAEHWDAVQRSPSEQRSETGQRKEYRAK